MNQVYTFDDVAIVPRYSEIESRLDTNIETFLTPNLKVSNCLLPSNMESVIGVNLAQIMIENNSIPILHRFYKNNELAHMVGQLIEKYLGRRDFKLILSCGTREKEPRENKELQLVLKLAAIYPEIAGVCFDTANGHTKAMGDVIRYTKNIWPKFNVIAGNVCTKKGAKFLIENGADTVKCGIGSGAACTTRLTTGIGVSQFSAIRECAKVAKEYGKCVISDGGCRNYRDFCLALAAGANTVMSGKLFAQTFESAGPKYIYEKEYDVYWDLDFCRNNPHNPFCYDDPTHTEYRGQASKEFQKDFYGELKKGTIQEGISQKLEITGSSQEVLDNYAAALRSSMSYLNSKTIEEYHKNAKFVRVTNSYMQESGTRK